MALELRGFAKTLERGEVAVWFNGREAFLAAKDAPRDVRGYPMGLRAAGYAYTACARGTGDLTDMAVIEWRVATAAEKETIG